MSGSELNRRLATLDASFLYTEKPNQPTHIGSIGVYEGELTREDVIAVMEQRLHLLPRYRQKVVFTPFGVNHPTWEDDTEFDIRNHVLEAELPAPGDDRVLAEEACRIYARVMDRGMPLWKLVLFRGYENGNTPMLSMIHHCMIDGVSGVDLILIMHDLTPDAPPPAPVPPWQPRPMPDALTLWQDGVRDALVRAAESWTEEQFRYLRPVEMAERARLMTAAQTSMARYVQQPAPATPFNGPLSGQKGTAWLDLPFAEVRAVKSALGGTVNDIVLAILSGGLGRYLEAKGYATRGVELRAMCPVSMRQPEQRGQLGNQVSGMLAPLFVGISDPVERLRAEREAMERNKNEGQAQALYAMSDQAAGVPAAWQQLTGQMDAPNTMVNTVSTNVPGPQIPLYLKGHRLTGVMPLGMCNGNIGLFVAITSYDKSLTFGITVDPVLVPDVWFVADCLRESFEELRQAAERSAAAAAKQPSEAAPGSDTEQRPASRSRARVAAEA